MIKEPVNQKRVRVIKEHCQGNFKVGMEGLCTADLLYESQYKEDTFAVWFDEPVRGVNLHTFQEDNAREYYEVIENEIMDQIDVINSKASAYIEKQMNAYYKRMDAEDEDDDDDFEFTWFERLLGVKTDEAGILLLWENEDGDIYQSVVPFADIFGDKDE